MLIWHDIILIFWIQRLVVRWHVDLIVGKRVAAEILEEVGVSGRCEVDVGVVGVFRLWRG
jgi:hypothetical protein